MESILKWGQLGPSDYFGEISLYQLKRSAEIVTLLKQHPEILIGTSFFPCERRISF